MTGKTVSHYRILDKLGGGMGELYSAKGWKGPTPDSKSLGFAAGWRIFCFLK